MMPTRMPESRLLTPETIPFTRYRDADAAVARLAEIYARNTAFLRERYTEYAQGKAARSERIRAYYPALRLAVDTYQEVDSRLSYGHVVEPGVYTTTVTQPGLFADYLREQIGLLLENHGVPVEVGESDVPMPLHFAFGDGEYIGMRTAAERLRLEYARLTGASKPGTSRR